MKKFLSILLFGVFTLLSTSTHATDHPGKPGTELKATPVFKRSMDVSTLKVDWTKKAEVKKVFSRTPVAAPYCSTSGIAVAWWGMIMSEAAGINYITTIYSSSTPCAECGTLYCVTVIYWQDDPVVPTGGN